MTDIRLWLALLAACKPHPEPSDPQTPPQDSTAPTVEVSIVGPEWGLRDLRCVVVEPLDVLSTVWTVDGRDTPNTTDVLPASELHPGESWTCRVTVAGEFTGESPPYEVPTPIGGNVLLVILDDVGIDKIGAYGVHPQPAFTPRIDRLIDEGVMFQTAYAAPSCSISRSQLLTGRYGVRTGFVETLSNHGHAFGLPDGEISIPEMLTGAVTGETWTTGAFGKWHLVDISKFDAESVTRQGFGTFSGTVGNLNDYFDWDHWWADGTRSRRTGYVTSAAVDDTLEFVAAAPEPWFAWLAFHAAHKPHRPPPPDLTVHDPLVTDPHPDLADAMIEAADTELGRLLDSMAPEVLARTTIIVMGDNGTDSGSARPPLDLVDAKLTVQEAGVRVPLVVAGYAVEGPARVSPALVDTVDLFATIADLAGVPLTGTDELSLPGDPPVPIDGRSMLPLLRDPEAVGERKLLYAAKAHPNGPPPWNGLSETVRDADWKFVFTHDLHQLYFLADETLDQGPDLMASGRLSTEASEAYKRLTTEFDRIRATPYAW